VVKNTIPNVSAVLFRRGELLEVLQEDLEFITSFKVAGDWAAYSAVLRTGRLAFVNIPLNNHRRDAGVTINSFGEGLIREIARMQMAVFDRVGATEEARRAADSYLQELYEQFDLASEAEPSWKQCERFSDYSRHELYRTA